MYYLQSVQWVDVPDREKNPPSHSLQVKCLPGAASSSPGSCSWFSPTRAEEPDIEILSYQATYVAYMY